MGGGEPSNSVGGNRHQPAVYYAKDNVQIHINAPRPGVTTSGIQGRISVIHYRDAPHLQWAPYSLLRDASVDWDKYLIRTNTSTGGVGGGREDPMIQSIDSVVSEQPAGPAAPVAATGGPAPVATPASLAAPTISLPVGDGGGSSCYAIVVPLDAIHSIKQKKRSGVLGPAIPHITVTLKGGVSLTPFHFHDGGLLKFLSALREHLTLTCMPGDTSTLLANDESDPLQRSLSQLKMEGVYTPTGNNFRGSIGAGRDRDDDLDMKEISLNVLDKFSRVTKLAREAGNIIFGQPQPGSSVSRAETDHHAHRPQTAPERLEEKIEEPLYDNTVAFNAMDNFGGEREPVMEGSEEGEGGNAASSSPEFHMVTGPSYSLEPVNVAPRGYIVDEDAWREFRDHESGRIVRESDLRQRIFYGGIEHALRKEIWPVLLDYYPANSTYEERRAIKEERTKQYNVLKNQWESIGDRQASRFTTFTTRVHRIEKDVTRTDRSQPYYAGDDNPNVHVLRDILVTYSFFNFDIGYCQGMSDLLGPILYVMDDEVDAFWCFVGLMDRVEANYNEDQVGMANQLSLLRVVVRVICPDLFEYFSRHDCLNLFFCFRWILIMFKREFPFADILRLWEMMWSHHRPNFYMFLAAAILKRFERYIIDTAMQFDDVLQFINELAMNLSLNDVMQDADKIFERIITDHSFDEELAPLLSQTFI